MRQIYVPVVLSLMMACSSSSNSNGPSTKSGSGGSGTSTGTASGGQASTQSTEDTNAKGGSSNDSDSTARGGSSNDSQSSANGGSATSSSSNATGGSSASNASKATGGSSASNASKAVGGGSAVSSSKPSTGGANSAIVDCGLPAAGATGKAKPSGEVGNFKILDWAGFTGAVTFTFDDGNSSQVHYYPELNQLGVHYTFFLVGKSAATDKDAWKQALADGHELGNHTQNHTQNDPEASDTAGGEQTIESLFGVKAYTMASPYGNDYSKIAPDYHFLCRGVSNGVIKANDDSSAFNTNCFIPSTDAKASDFDPEIDAARAAKGWKVVLVHGFTGTDYKPNDYAYQPVDIAEFTKAVQNVKDAGDMWVDSFVNVGAYWRGQAAIAKVKATTSGSDQVWTWSLPEHFPPGKCVRATVGGGTLKQADKTLEWDPHGYYELSLDAGSVTLSP